MAASMGSVIAMAGDEIHMAANGLLMIHNPWTGSVGDAEQLRKDADLLDKMGNNIRNSYDRSNLSADELQAAMDAETYYTAEKALEAGFIDSISDANLAAASIGDMETLKEFASIPQAKIDGIKIDCQAKQIEALSAKADELTGELECRSEELLIASAEVETIKGEIETLKTDHSAALEKASEETAKAVADKAAELLASVGAPPLEEDTNQSHIEPSANKMTPDDFWAGYNALSSKGDFEGKNSFYAEHKHVIGQ